jgi:hypothetical protein
LDKSIVAARAPASTRCLIFIIVEGDNVANRIEQRERCIYTGRPKVDIENTQ